jgi:hypothetical protein
MVGITSLFEGMVVRTSSHEALEGEDGEEPDVELT